MAWDSTWGSAFSGPFSPVRGVRLQADLSVRLGRTFSVRVKPDTTYRSRHIRGGAVWGTVRCDFFGGRNTSVETG
jgi:hypothetical protein